MLLRIFSATKRIVEIKSENGFRGFSEKSRWGLLGRISSFTLISHILLALTLGDDFTFIRLPTKDFSQRDFTFNYKVLVGNMMKAYQAEN
ncbi:hypothetical protein SLA2020_446780 [Shorea laevis]